MSAEHLVMVRRACGIRVLPPLLFALMMGLCGSTRAWAQTPAALASPTVAHIQGQAVSLAQIDEAGGRAVYDALQQLYEMRVRALYQVLSDDLIHREASSRHLTTDALLEEQVVKQARTATDTEVQETLKANGAPEAADARTREQARLYLNMRYRADQKRSYVATLMKKYDVRVALDAPPPPPPEDVSGPEEPALGLASAPVSVVVYSDYLCPYCKQLSQTLDQLRERYPRDVKIVYRNFPVHNDSPALAEAALCADAQGHFEAFHRLLFQTATPKADQLPALAGEAKLDTAAFSQCLDSGRFRARVDADRAQGERLGITGTPTLFVNGFRMSGLQSLERLSSQVSGALKTRTASR